jgi:hypothetical protein
MSLTDDNNNNNNGGYASAPAPTLYVFLIIAFVLQFLRLAIDLDMLDLLCSYCSLLNMVCLISMFLAIFCLLFSWIKYYGKLLNFPIVSGSLLTKAVRLLRRGFEVGCPFGVSCGFFLMIVVLGSR